MARYPCPECGAKRGDPHKLTCSRVSKRRGVRRLPKSKGRFTTCVNHKPVVYETHRNMEYLRCRTCHKYLGKREKGS